MFFVCIISLRQTTIMKNNQLRMKQELKEKLFFEKAQEYAFSYIENIDTMDVFPSAESLNLLKNFDEKMPTNPCASTEVLDILEKYGRPNSVAQTGGRYFGFVNGGAVPASLGVKHLTDVWDQCSGLYLTSPINSKMELVCESWLKDIFNLPESTVAGFVSGTSMANFCGVAAARYHILAKQGWDINKKGLYGAPPIRIVAHEQVHASIKKTLVLLGFGEDNIEWIPSDNQGTIIVEKLPPLDATCIVVLQAGNANTGGFDDFESVCNIANAAGAWVHVDGAFGMWAAACPSLAHLTKGMEKADSWSTDGHKTLNTPYDSGVIMCKHQEAIYCALQAKGEYIIYSEMRDPMSYTPEMSKRSRAIELWATLKYLGREGIDEMITGFHHHAKTLEKGLRSMGLTILNDVVFNQVLVCAEDEEETKRIVQHIQQSGKAWLGGTTWLGKAAIRVSVCSWYTSEEDINITLKVFEEALTHMHV